jgi:hypothetical protein
MMEERKNASITRATWGDLRIHVPIFLAARLNYAIIAFTPSLWNGS